MIRIIVFFFLLALPAWSTYPPEIKDAREETYRKIGNVDLKVWIVGETLKDQVKPAVVLFFGGGWHSGSPDTLLKHARFLAEKGMICLLADYRVSSRHGTKIADCVADAKAAFAWTKKNADRLGIDSTKIAAGGASAGGHMAACVALAPDPGDMARPNALLLFNPALVLAPFQGNDFGSRKRLTKEMAGADPEAISPIHNLHDKAPPTWITHGNLDFIVPLKTTKAFCEKMKEKELICELLVASYMPHAFHYRDPWFTKVMTSAGLFFESLGWLEKE